MTALKSDSKTPYLQFYGWDSYEHIRRAVIFMLNSDSGENCKHCKHHVLSADDTVIISNPNPAVVRRFIKDYAYNTNTVVNQVSGVNAIIDADDNTTADNATGSVNNASSDYNSNAIITAASTVSSNASSSVNSAAANNANNNVNSSAIRVYAVARKSDACIIMLLVMVDDCVSVIPRFDADGVSRADIVSIVKNFIVKYGNMMVRLFLDSDSVIYGLLLDAGFKPVGKHDTLSAFVNMVSNNVLMTAGDSVSNNASNIAVSDGCVRVVSSGSQLFVLFSYSMV